MSKEFFLLKNLKIWHHQCSMKVGTDGVLLGAWCQLEGKREMLDIGCGCGVLSLMAARRNPHLSITSLDIDEQSVNQTINNFIFNDIPNPRTILLQDFRTWLPHQHFDLIVSNPPFFVEDTLSGDQRADMARHTVSLDFQQLAEGSRRLLTSDGTFCIIIPFCSASSFIGIAAEKGLYLRLRTDVFTKTGKSPKRTLLSFETRCQPSVHNTLTLFDENNEKTPEYSQLTHDFYL